MENENRKAFYSQIVPNNPPEILFTEETISGIDTDVTSDNTSNTGFKETREIHVSRQRWMISFGAATAISVLFLVLVIYFAARTSSSDAIKSGSCLSCPCENGATCTDFEDSYTCACVPGYRGNNCETDIDECYTTPCRNGGTCVDNINSFTCVCPSGYSDTSCGTEINECSSNPCQNGGICVDRVNSYKCNCKPKYNGTNCEMVTCASGWKQYNAKCFIFVKKSKTWHEAKNICRQKEGSLVEIHDKATDIFLKKTILTLPGNDYHFFTGGTDQQQHGSYVWDHSGMSLSFIDWAPGQPGGGNEHCLVLDYKDNYKFHDYPCTSKLGYICEKPLG